MLRPPSSNQYGFTLIEVMVVIVIVSILASLIVLNVGGVDQRKAMQSREIFIMDMQRILREANDQSRILALSTQQATDVRAAQYQIIEYQPITRSTAELSTRIEKWKAYSDFKRRELPNKVSFNITALDYDVEGASNRELLGMDAPDLIWLGNGEVRPVRIQFYFEGRPIGAELEIDHLGKINES